MDEREWRRTDRKRRAAEQAAKDEATARAVMRMARDWPDEPFLPWKAREITVAMFFLLTHHERRILIRWAHPRSLLRPEVERLFEDEEAGLLD